MLNNVNWNKSCDWKLGSRRKKAVYLPKKLFRTMIQEIRKIERNTSGSATATPVNNNYGNVYQLGRNCLLVNEQKQSAIKR
jgi:hypothetical protein